MKKRIHFLADLWSQSEFRTQRMYQLKTNPKSEMTHQDIGKFCGNWQGAIFSQSSHKFVQRFWLFSVNITPNCSLGAVGGHWASDFVQPP